MRSIFAFILSLLLLPASVGAATVFERESTNERETFEDVPLADAPVLLDDPRDDLVVFDRNGGAAVPPLLADITKVSLTEADDGWRVQVTTDAPFPADPGMPVNFHVYIDRPEVPNAPSGVFRASSDLAFLLLFGTRTKWHSEHWTYDAASGRWLENTPFPFTVGERDFTLTLPYSVLPRDSQGSIRFLALTSDNAGSTAIDVAPGEGLPAAQSEPTANPPPQEVEPDQAVEPDDDRSSVQVILLVTLLSLAVCTSAMAFLQHIKRHRAL